LKEDLFRIRRYPNSKTPAKTILKPVRNKGGLRAKAIFPKENIVVQVANMRTARRICIGFSIF
jgi:hypothetical protein